MTRWWMGRGTSAVAVTLDQVDGDLNFYNWTDYMDPELITSFESEYGVDIVESFYDSNEAMLAQLQAGASYDLMFLPTTWSGS